MGDFRKLRVWRAAHALTLAIYRATERFPASERYRLCAQLRRSPSSIGANLAEGCGRGTDADARRCFQLAFGSACEVLNHLLLARDLGLLDAPSFVQVESQAEPVRRMLYGLVTSPRPKTQRPPRAPQPEG